MIEIAYTIEHAERYDSLMVIVVIPSPLNITYIRPPGGQSNHKADRDIAHHTSHITSHAPIHPSHPAKRKEKEGNHSHSLTAQPSKGRKNPPVTLPLPSPLQAEKHRSPGHDTDRRLDISEQSKNAKWGAYIHTYIRTLHTREGRKNEYAILFPH